MHWTIEVELPGGTWLTLCRCLTIDAACAVVKAIVGPQVQDAKRVMVTWLPVPLESGLIPSS